MPAAAHSVAVNYEQVPATCYALTRTHTGTGGDPAATPGNSAGCATGQYVAGAVIDLSASPGAGWSVVSWTGTDDDGSTSLSNQATMPAAAHTVTVHYEAAPAGSSLDIRVSASTDDAEEKGGDGSIARSGDDLELGEDRTPQLVGLRFQNLTIPRGASITRAYVEFTADEIQGDTTNATFHGQASDNAPTFGSGTGDISARPRTLAAVDWPYIAPWTEKHTTYQSPDLSPIVQGDRKPQRLVGGQRASTGHQRLWTPHGGGIQRGAGNGAHPVHRVCDDREPRFGRHRGVGLPDLSGHCARKQPLIHARAPLMVRRDRRHSSHTREKEGHGRSPWPFFHPISAPRGSLSDSHNNLMQKRALPLPGSFALPGRPCYNQGGRGSTARWWSKADRNFVQCLVHGREGTMAFIGQRSKSETIEGFRDHVSSGKAAFFAQYGMEFVPGRREGVYLWDVDGDKRLINCHCNGGVFNLGHRHPVIVETLKRALDELDIGNHHLISEQRAALARRLAELAPGDLPYSVFAVGGGEAIDFALKLARAHTGRPGIISARGGYHGHTGSGPGCGRCPVPRTLWPDAPRLCPGALWRRGGYR